MYKIRKLYKNSFYALYLFNMIVVFFMIILSPVENPTNPEGIVLWIMENINTYEFINYKGSIVINKVVSLFYLYIYPITVFFICLIFYLMQKEYYAKEKHNNLYSNEINFKDILSAIFVIFLIMFFYSGKMNYGDSRSFYVSWGTSKLGFATLHTFTTIVFSIYPLWLTLKLFYFLNKE